jgi:hypothetical protein
MDKIICLKCGAENKPNVKYCVGCGFELPRIQTEISSDTVDQKSIPASGKMNRFIGIFVGMMFFFITYYAVQHFFFKPGAVSKEMMNIASELNKACPVMVDSITRLDNTIAMPGNVFQYNYTLVNIEKDKLDITGFQNSLEPRIVNLVKTSPQMQYQRDHKWTLNYLYKDKNGVYIFMIVVSPDKYENQ